jgi:hypothetical protein
VTRAEPSVSSRAQRVGPCSGAGATNAAAPAPPVIVSGTVGSSVRPNVEFATPANDAYAARRAAANPVQPPMWTIAECPPALPMPSSRNVTASARKTAAIAAVVRSDATNMYAVKMAHAIR